MLWFHFKDQMIAQQDFYVLKICIRQRWQAPPGEARRYNHRRGDGQGEGGACEGAEQVQSGARHQNAWEGKEEQMGSTRNTSDL